MEGWVSLHRKIMEWEWYQDHFMLKLFVHLLLKANHNDGKWQGNEIKRGQLITGINKLSIETGISIQSIKTCLKKLKRTGEISIKPTNQYSVITICNYDTYQYEHKSNNNPAKDHSKTRQRSTNIQSTTNNKEKKEIEELKEKEYSDEIINFYNQILLYFPEKTRPKEVALRKGWLETIEKLKNEGYSLNELKKITTHFRNDSFWASHFMAINYLTKKNKDGVRYIDVFVEKLKSEHEDYKITNEKMQEIQASPTRMKFK